jgi:biopolymer transport protein ExbD
MRIPSYTVKSGVGFNMTPMIDLVFLLMIFFLLGSRLARRENQLALSSPLTESGQALPPDADFDPVVIRILHTESGPAWEVNSSPVASLDEVRGALAAVARIKRDVPVILDADRSASLGDVIDVLDLSRQAGLTKIQFATGAD